MHCPIAPNTALPTFVLCLCATCPCQHCCKWQRWQKHRPRPQLRPDPTICTSRTPPPLRLLCTIKIWWCPHTTCQLVQSPGHLLSQLVCPALCGCLCIHAHSVFCAGRPREGPPPWTLGGCGIDRLLQASGRDTPAHSHGSPSGEGAQEGGSARYAVGIAKVARPCA